MRPTRNGIYALAATLVVALLPTFGWSAVWPVVPVLWGAFALVYGVDALRSPRRRDLAFELRAPTQLYIGRSDELTLALALPGAEGAPCVVALELSDDLVPQPHARGELDEEERTFTWTLQPRRRGVVRVEGAAVRYRSPLGLWEWIADLELGHELGVLPDLPTVRAMALRFFDDPTFRSGLKIERYRGDGTEFEALREFTSGDDRRAIDWKASARLRNLLTRQYRAERNHQVCVAVDTGHLMGEPVGGVPKLDHALNAALLLAYVCLKSGDRVGFHSFDARIGPGLPPTAGVSTMEALRQLAARLEYSTVETNFTLGLTTLGQKLRRRSLILLLTDFVDSVTAELMMENLGVLAKRHLVVFVSLRDPQLSAQLRVLPRDEEDLNRAVVARNFVRDREEVHARLRAAGVMALDVEPAQVGPELINRYLDIKRRELI
ncbi:MAG: DUF58 domain-containing protein [Planctomycetes bacterium]|nr:DUF58 domain-containing protein [Planctomycetota bacterium]